MGGHLGRRLSRLEQEVTPAMRVAYVWWKCPEEETEEQAIAQQFPVRVVLVRWLTPGEAAGIGKHIRSSFGNACRRRLRAGDLDGRVDLGSFEPHWPAARDTHYLGVEARAASVFRGAPRLALSRY
jgi:hypothetical protein